MRKPSSSTFGKSLGVSSWPAALIGIVAIKAVLSLAVKPGSFVAGYSAISYLLLLFLATCFAIRNGIQNRAGGRLFWALLATSFGLWTAHESLQLYYELCRHMEVPANSIDDSLLFLHAAVLTAAVATFPHRADSNRKPYTAVLNAAFVTLFWILLYGYLVFPYQYLLPSAAPFNYSLRFDTLYLGENLALILMVGLLFSRAEAPWKSIYLHLLGAGMLYAMSSTFANLAIDYLGGYFNGKLYGLGLTASICWFVWVPQCARQIRSLEIKEMPSDESPDSETSVWAMLVVVSFSIPVVWELLKRNENAEPRTLRVVFAVAMIVCLASAAYTKEYLTKRELTSRFGLANDRLHLAMQAGSAMAWESDVKSGRGVWFGDLRTILGIDSDTHATSVDEFIGRVHPDDRQQVSEALADAKQNHKLFTPEFRIVRPDGTVRWLETRGKFYYAKSGGAERMIGISLDTTERKKAQEAISGVSRKLVEAQEQERARIARELHDDITQRLALVAAELSQLQDQNNDLPSKVRSRMHDLQQMTSGVSASLHTLSHELHSSTLQYVGLVKGMKSWCQEFAARQQVEIAFESNDLPKPSQDVSLCLFRVLQEALQNAVKHSGTKQVDVRLAENAGAIHLTVRDSGRGFDFESALRNGGLGLTSMRERVRLVGGTIVFDSKPAAGTTIRVCVPIAAEPEAA
jgi:signal transduction histidine kinase